MSFNNFFKCEKTMCSVCTTEDLITSQILSELSETSICSASAYLRYQEKNGRLELVGKAVSEKRGPKVFVYRVIDNFFLTPPSSKKEETNHSKQGGVRGRRWEVREAPLIPFNRG